MRIIHIFRRFGGALRLHVSSVWRRESGDTLIEVTMALSILSMVVLSSSVLATKAFQMGQTARERTALVNEAQNQMEAVRAFRDSYPWDVFLHGDPVNPLVRGMLLGEIDMGGSPEATPGSGCYVYSPCLHMTKLTPTSDATPWQRAMAGSVPTSYIEISVVPDDPLNPMRLDIYISYGATAIGSSPDLKGHIKTTLTRVSVAASVSGGAPPPPPPPGFCTEGDKDIVLVLDVSGSMGSPWQDRGGGSNPGLRKIDKQKSVANSFVAQTIASRPGNRIALVFFNNGIAGAVGFTSNVANLQSAINARNPGGTTAYIPPLQLAERIFNGTAGLGPAAGPERVVVFVSDGRPNQDGGAAMSGTARQNLIWAERDTMTTSKLYSVGVDGDPLMFNILRGLSSRGMVGGFFGDAGSAPELDAVFADISLDLACPGGVGALPPPLPPPPPPNPALCVSGPHNIVVVIDDSQATTDPWPLPDPMTKQFAWSLNTLDLVTNVLNANPSNRIVTVMHNALDGVRDTAPWSNTTLGASNLLTNGQARSLPDWTGAVTRSLQLAMTGGDILIFIAFGPRSAAELSAGIATNPGALANTKIYTVGVDANTPSDFSALPAFSAAGKAGGFYTYAESSSDLRSAYEEIYYDILCNG